MFKNSFTTHKKNVIVSVLATALLILIFAVVFMLANNLNNIPIKSCIARAVDNAGLSQDVSAEITDDVVSLILPNEFSLNKVILDIDFEGESLQINDTDFVNHQNLVPLRDSVITLEQKDKSLRYFNLYITIQGRTDNQLQQFKFEASKNPSIQSDIVCDVWGNRISGYFPPTADFENLIPTFFLPSGRLYTGDKEIISGEKLNFNELEKLVCKTGDKEREYTLELKHLVDDTLPCVYIYGDSYAESSIPSDRHIDFKNPKNANFSIFNSQNPLIETNEYVGEKISIKLRGNSSLDFPKKNFTLRFENKVSLFGMKKSRKYTLQSNYCDKSLMRNAVALTLSSKLDGIDFTSDYRYVNLFINGQYAGNYMLIERIDVGKDRLDITEQTGKGDISGGYLLEMCARNNKDYMIHPAGYSVSIRYPEVGELTNAQVDYITDYFEKMIEQINSGKNIEKYIDVDSFVDWLLLNEFLKANDAKGYASVYLYKDAGDVMHMGPVWDYDISSGNCDYGEPGPEGEWIGKHMWFPELLQNPDFLAKAKSRWAEIRGDMYAVFDDIDRIKSEIYKSQEDNFKRWHLLGHYIWPNGAVCDTYDGEINYLKTWLAKRLKWMDSVYFTK